MRLAVLQSPSPEGDLDAGLSQVELALRSAGATGVDALVVPEVFLPGYNHAQMRESALSADAAAFRRLSDAVAMAGTALVLGFAEALGARVYNTAMCFGPDGKELARYRKVQLFGAREKAIFTPGERYVTFDLAGRKAAMLICYDIEFAPHVAALAGMGTEVILVPTANMAPHTHVSHHTIPAMAANYGLSIAYANYCGTERDLNYEGGSIIAGPHGEVLAQAGDYPALLIAEVPNIDFNRRSTQAEDFRPASPSRSEPE